VIEDYEEYDLKEIIRNNPEKGQRFDFDNIKFTNF